MIRKFANGGPIIVCLSGNKLDIWNSNVDIRMMVLRTWWLQYTSLVYIVAICQHPPILTYSGISNSPSLVPISINLLSIYAFDN